MFEGRPMSKKVDLTQSAPSAEQLDAARKLSPADREARIHELELELIALKAEPYVEWPKMVTTHDGSRHQADSAEHEKALQAKPKAVKASDKD